jgi:hypothetical protein
VIWRLKLRPVLIAGAVWGGLQNCATCRLFFGDGGRTNMIMNIARTARMLAAAAIMAAGVAASAGASTLSFTFSFNNDAFNGGGTVTGVVSGLQDNATSAATSVMITSNTLGFGLGEYVGNPSSNSWTLAGGVITVFSFLSFGAGNTSPVVTDSSLILTNQLAGKGIPAAGLANLPSAVGANIPARSVDLTFTQVDDVAPVPLPAGGLLLIGALGALAALRRRMAA